MICQPRTGDGPGPRRRPERPETGVWVAAALIAAGLAVSAGGAVAGALPAALASPTAALAPGSPGFVGTVLPGTPAGTATGTPAATAATPALSTVAVDPAALTTALPDERARTAVEVAMKQIGLPYVWGGNGPEDGHRGFDCSGLTTFAYGKAGVRLPRTAHTQFRHGPRVPAGAPLQPGDLVFYGTYAKVHHVGMYIGQGRMVNAPTFGEPVQTAWYRWNGDDYIGATRPATTGTGTIPDPAVPETPDPAVPDRPEFTAPVAPPLAEVPDPRAPQPPATDSAREAVTGSGGTVTPTPPTTATTTSAGRTFGTEGGADPATPGGTTPDPTTPGSTTPGTTTPGTTTPGTTTPDTTTPGPSTSAGPPPGPTTPGPATPGPTTPGPTTPGPTTPGPTTPGPTTPGPTTPKPTAPPTTTPGGPPSPTPTTTGPAPTTPAPTTPAPTPTSPSPGGTEGTTDAVPTAVVVGGATHRIPEVGTGPDGLPSGPGHTTSGGRTTARLGSATTAAVGDTVTLRLSDGTTRRFTVASVTGTDIAGARAARGALVVLAPAGEGRWTVLTAS